MRVDDALSMLDSFLDRLYGRGEHVAFIEHGFGTGALREAVRSHLESPSPYVESMRAAGRGRRAHHGRAPALNLGSRA